MEASLDSKVCHRTLSVVMWKEVVVKDFHSFLTQQLSIKERTILLVFLIHCFNSLVSCSCHYSNHSDQQCTGLILSSSISTGGGFGEKPSTKTGFPTNLDLSASCRSHDCHMISYLRLIETLVVILIESS